ncbi:MAG TPA: hypothetical protein VLX61_12180 [Anaerolineales bacterium]|nr:hypothetical protein [Anaerolineales bacterium]
MKLESRIRTIILSGLKLMLAGIVLILLIFGSILGMASVQLPACKISAPASTGTALQLRDEMDLSLPGHPFGAVASPDGHWVFVAIDQVGQGPQGIAILSRDGISTKYHRLISLPDAPYGLTITQDGGLLLATSGDGVAFIDVSRATTGTSDAVLGYVNDGNGAGTIEVILSKDERFAFATDENRGVVSVIDMGRVRTGNFSNAIVGRIPADIAPVGMALSPDGRYLYVTSEFRKLGDSYHLLTAYVTGIGDALGLVHPAGTLTVIDAARAESDPTKSVIARVSAGCSPVRVALSPSGDIAWVTARRANTLEAFDTGKLLQGSSPEMISTTAVGVAPVGVTLLEGGKIALVANSNRFENSQLPQTLSLIDTTAALTGKPAFYGAIRVGVFPRELYLTPDGNILLVTNYDSNSLTAIQVSRIEEVFR